jgi:hypothetical protein
MSKQFNSLSDLRNACIDANVTSVRVQWADARKLITQIDPENISFLTINFDVASTAPLWYDHYHLQATYNTISNSLLLKWINSSTNECDESISMSAIVTEHNQHAICQLLAYNAETLIIQHGIDQLTSLT